MEKEITTVVIAAMPVLELRWAMPYALNAGIPVLKAYILCFIGNMIPVIPILLFLQPVSEKLRHIGIFRKFFDWLFERTRKRAGLVEKFETLGLILFVAVPLPITGAWTGCVAASLFKIRIRYAVPAIAIGVLIAGLLVTGVSKAIFSLLGVGS